MINLVIFGPPGAGKGTQSAKIKEMYQLEHLSTGDLFRYNIKNETSLGKQAKEIIDKGELVPDEITNNMVEDFLERNISTAKGFIFDGFPRNTAQAHALDKMLEKQGQEIHLTLSLEVPEEELIKRLLERGKDSGRADDQNEEVIQNRLAVYNNQTKPLLDFYETKDLLVNIKGTGEIDQIFERITLVINSI